MYDIIAKVFSSSKKLLSQYIVSDIVRVSIEYHKSNDEMESGKRSNGLHKPDAVDCGRVALFNHFKKEKKTFGKRGDKRLMVLLESLPHKIDFSYGLHDCMI